MTNPLFDALLAPHIASLAPFIEGPDAQNWNYCGLLEVSARYSNAMIQLGVVPGDRVALQVHKSPQALAVYFACIRSGFVLLPLNPDYTAAEVAYFIDDATPAVLICDPAFRDGLEAVSPQSLETLAADGTGSFTDLAASQPNQAAVVPRGTNDLAAILYTSGTTGRPKGAMLSHGNLLSNAQVLCEAWRFRQDDVLLHALPIFHTHGLFVAVNVTLLAGGSLIFLRRFDLDEVLKWLPWASVMMGVPTFYTRLLESAEFGPELCRNMRLFISGSAPLLAETHANFESVSGHRILERYGMTETSMSTSNPYGGERRAGTVGKLLPGVEGMVVDRESGDEVPPGKVGILRVRGPNVFLGYWKMPDKTAAELLEDGYFVTGDLARIGADGYIEIVGRVKDLIISGGLNIYPKEVEIAIDGVPGIAEAAVIGLPDDDLGEVVCAVVVRNDGASLGEAEILAAISNRLARFKRPRVIRFVDALPRNSMGKVQKNLLREGN